MFPQFKSFEALQTVRSSIVSLCMIFKSILKGCKVSKTQIQYLCDFPHELIQHVSENHTFVKNYDHKFNIFMTFHFNELIQNAS